MIFEDRLRLATKLKLFGAQYTFTRITETNPVNTEQNPNPDAVIDAAYKTKVKTTSTFTEWAFVRPARAYAVHSNVQVMVREGGNEMTGIINVEMMYNTAVRVGDAITTPDGIYDLVAKEDFAELYIFEGHKR